VSNEVRASTADQAEFRGELFAAGLLIESGANGVYGHGEPFERVRDRLTKVVSEIAGAEGASKLSFPPVMPRRDLETNGYVANFPHLTGSIFGFEGSESEARAQGELAAVHEDWSGFQSQTDVMMVPAACYPLYPAIAGRGPLDPGGACFDLGDCWVFRNEPSLDPARRQSFRVHELVRIGEPEAVMEWRSEWCQRGAEMLGELGLDSHVASANDPFFGRQGRLLAANQTADDLKWEILVPITGSEPTACASFNYHLDHFGEVWGLKLSDGTTAHTACLGFGQDRIVLALLRTHGLDPSKWPTSVRDRLGV